MKGVPKIILTILLSLVWVSLVVTYYFYWKSNPVSYSNGLKSSAKEAFYAREFLRATTIYRTLFDSVDVKDDALSMNYANSAMMSSNILLNGFYGSSGKVKLPDSTLSALADISELEYSQLTGAEDPELASLAFNQRGFVMLKKGDILHQPNGDSTLAAALEYFKDALRRNSENDSARYNYELVKRLAAYPQKTMKDVQSLVDAHRYKEAIELLESAMQKNPLLNNKQDYLTRLKQVAQIDSIYRRSR